MLPELCEVVAIADIRTELARKVARRYDIPHVYASYQEMLRKEKLDGIVATLRFRLHGTLVPDLPQAGIPIFTEKPLAGSLQQGEKIARPWMRPRRRRSRWSAITSAAKPRPATRWPRSIVSRPVASWGRSSFCGLSPRRGTGRLAR